MGREQGLRLRLELEVAGAGGVRNAERRSGGSASAAAKIS
jgi:hypothetical protein